MRPWRVLTLITLGAAFACAQERPPVDRTQPDGLEKAFFVGPNYLETSDDPEFWAQATLVDVGYGASQDGLFSSSYAQPVTRIKWVVQEDLLIGRLTYERIAGSDGKGAGPASRDGQIAYAFKITSHFDRRRAYNPITGEETNVVEENTTDRPWYARDFMRVDWAKNLVEDAYELDTLSQLGVFGGVEYEGLAYYVNDPQHADAPHFADGYFDITNKAFAKPKTIDLAALGLGPGSIPACFLPADFSGGTEPIGNCNPVELTIRQSFRRVVDSDYEPMEWDGLRFQAFGAFTTERKGYARNYGLSDDRWHRLIARYNVWTQTHAYADPQHREGPTRCFTPETTPAGADPHRDENADGTEDECAAVGLGSRCDELSQKCTLPYRLRTPRPIVWYYTADSHPEFFAATAEAAQQWDVAMRGAVMAARYAECMRVEKSEALCAHDAPVYTRQQDDNDDALALAREVDDCRAGEAYAGKDCAALAGELGAARNYSAGVIHLARQPELVVLCHSPVADADPAVCGERGMVVRAGDLRFHQVNVFRAPQTPSPWGIYTDAHDPLTGETIAASINVWSHVTDLFSQSVVDKVRYAKGELSTAQVTEGKNVHDWARANLAASGGLLPVVSRAELESRVASFAGASVAQMRDARSRVMSRADLVSKLARLDRELADTRADLLRSPSSAAAYRARKTHARGSALESELDTLPMRQLAGVDALGGAAATEYSSPLRGNDPSLWRTLAQQRELALADRGACLRLEGPSPTALTGLADVLVEKFGALSADEPLGVQLARAERMRRYVADRAHFSVILHEMGHSIGLRHNFVSSSDALSYRPQYWQLRTQNGANTTECTDAVSDGATCVGPRWFDPVSEDERRQLLPMFMHSSTMDYAGEYTQDMLGLGAYDFAAARMFYGDVVAVHRDPSYGVGQPRGTAMLAKADNFGGIVGFTWSTDGDEQRHGIHYSQLQRHFSLIQDCQSVDPQSLRPASWDEARLGPWHPVLDGQIVQVGGAYTRCRQQPVDYVSWSSLRAATAAEAGGLSRGGGAVDPAGRTRVPYGFATDRWADLGNLSVYRHDNGADPYELFDFFISEQEVGHIFDNYRRGRTSFSVRGAVMRTLARYNEKMRDGAKGLGLFANIYREFALAEGFDFNSLWPAVVGSRPGEYNGLSTNVLAAGIAFDHFTRMLGRPEAGDHERVPGDEVLRSVNDSAGNPGESVVQVANGAAGAYGDVSLGGRPVANTLGEGHGEYDAEYTVNAGSYYEKVFSPMLLTESVDNFISDSRRDFVDARYRAVSMADLFPDGYRRWLANNLTGDDRLKGAWVRARGGLPVTDGSDKWPASPIGWTSWWPAEAQVCMSRAGAASCASYPDGNMGSGTEAEVVALDPQVGWEQQKFLVAMTLTYLPENQQQTWLEQMGMWSVGEDTDPGFGDRIELHTPRGETFVAKTFGTEVVLGRRVQRGIAARVLEYGNSLLARAYVTDPGPDLDGDRQPDWVVPRLGAQGQPVVRWDSSVGTITPEGNVSGGRTGCNRFDSTQCRCEDNRACVQLARYVSLPKFFRTALRDLGLADPTMKGLF